MYGSYSPAATQRQPASKKKEIKHWKCSTRTKDGRELPRLCSQKVLEDKLPFGRQRDVP